MFVFLFFSISDPFTMIYLEGDRAMLTCTGEYNETIQISSVLYSVSAEAETINQFQSFV
jgi:hypothetical protein